MSPLVFRSVVIGATLLPVAAFAQSAGMTTTDLNLRAGPGSNYAVLTTIPSGGAVTINGCVENSAWCQVDYDGSIGYGYARYLAVTATTGTTVVVEEQRSLVPSIATNTIDAVGNTVGAVTGALVGGTVGVVSGGAEGLSEGVSSGATAGANTFDIADDDVVYVRQNPREPVYLDGEAVVGVGVPANVALYEVPGSTYRYVNVNGSPVLVEPSSRQIVYVVR